MFYRAALSLSHQTLTFVSGLVRVHRREIGTPWRALNPDVLAVCDETVELLAARAPKYRPRSGRRSVKGWPT